MATLTVAQAYALRPISKGQRIWMNFKKHWRLHLLFAPATIYYLLFEVLPLFGLQVAFRTYRARDGFFGSAWVGITNFLEFFEYYEWKKLTVNTLALSLYNIAAGFPIPIILAMILHINERKVLKKITQNVSYVPHFISAVVLVGLLNSILNPISGLLGAFCREFGIEYTMDIMTSEPAFRHVYVWSGIWQGMGWSTIMYVAALSGVSHELHEAATIDGASRLRRVFSVDIPAIMPFITLNLIMRFSRILSVGQEKAYMMQNSLNLDKSEIISTYVYKYGLANNRTGYGSAVGLMNSAINSVLLIIVNWIANWMSDGEQGLW